MRRGGDGVGDGVVGARAAGLLAVQAAARTGDVLHADDAALDDRGVHRLAGLPAAAARWLLWRG